MYTLLDFLGYDPDESSFGDLLFGKVRRLDERLLEYLDIDTCNSEDKNTSMNDILSRGGRLAYPTIIVDDELLLTGPTPEKLREVLEL